MDKTDINPQYKAELRAGKFVIIGTENTTGESVVIEDIPGGKDFASELSDILNRNKVSVCHAKDVIKDRLLAFLL